MKRRAPRAPRQTTQRETQPPAACRPSDDEPEAIAYHEAGHAVAYAHFGIAFESVAIGLDGRVAGDLKQAPIRISVEQRIAFAILSLVGPAAEIHWRALRFPNEPDYRQKRWRLRMIASAWTDDLDKARTLIASDELEECLGSAVAFVEEYWPSVERVARLLLKHGSLTGDDVVAALAPASHDEEPEAPA